MGGYYLMKSNGGDSWNRIFVLYWRCPLIRGSVPLYINHPSTIDATQPCHLNSVVKQRNHHQKTRQQRQSRTQIILRRLNTRCRLESNSSVVSKLRFVEAVMPDFDIKKSRLKLIICLSGMFTVHFHNIMNTTIQQMHLNILYIYIYIYMTPTFRPLLAILREWDTIKHQFNDNNMRSESSGPRKS
jgi:hypothetical protein